MRSPPLAQNHPISMARASVTVTTTRMILLVILLSWSAFGSKTLTGWLDHNSLPGCAGGLFVGVNRGKWAMRTTLVPDHLHNDNRDQSPPGIFFRKELDNEQLKHQKQQQPHHKFPLTQFSPSENTGNFKKLIKDVDSIVKLQYLLYKNTNVCLWKM